VTSFEAWCEACDDYHDEEPVFQEPTPVTGSLRLGIDVGFTTCRRGHRLCVRRISRAPLRAVR
jgi:hypothetical protein